MRKRVIGGPKAGSFRVPSPDGAFRPCLPNANGEEDRREPSLATSIKKQKKTLATSIVEKKYLYMS